MTQAPIILLGPGYSCQALARLARQSGYTIHGSARSAESRAALSAADIQPFEWQVGSPLPDDATLPIVPGAAVIYSVPTLYDAHAPGEPGELARHVAPVEQALAWAIEREAACFIYLSSSSVLGDQQGAWVDEDTPAAPISAYGKMRHDIEQHLMSRHAPLDLYVARLVGIYGPGRTIVEAIRAGRYKLVNPEKPVNRVHVDDIAQTLLAMIERGPRGPRLYNVCDGAPVSALALVEMLEREFGVPRPAQESLEQARQRDEGSAARWEANYRCGNKRMVEELGVTPRYPDALSGYRAILTPS